MKGLSAAGLAAGLALLASAGCCTPCASTGWRFEVGRPAVFSSPGLVQQNTGPLSLSPLGTTIPPLITGTAAQAGAVQLYPAAPPPQLLPPPRQMQAAPPQECTCEQLLQLLQRIDARLSAMALPKKLDKGPELEE
jgi:hypothetical protein